MSKEKINKLLIGTNNKGKLLEIKNLLPKNIKLVACYHPSPRNVNTGRINEKKMKNLFKRVLKLN